MLTLGHTDVSDSIGSKPTYEDLGKLHIKEGELLLQQHARAQIGPCKLNRICEVLTRFYFGERGQTSSRPALSGQKEDIPLFGRISADAARTSAFTLYKEYVGYGGKSASLRYPWSALGNHDGYAGFWRLSCWSQSPKLVDIDADELVHLLYTYAVLFQTEMELRGLKLALQCSDALANALESRDMRFSVSLSM